MYFITQITLLSWFPGLHEICDYQLIWHWHLKVRDKHMAWALKLSGSTKDINKVSRGHLSEENLQVISHFLWEVGVALKTKCNLFPSPAIPCYVNLCWRNHIGKKSYENHENICQNDSNQTYEKIKNLQKLINTENGY